MKSLRKIFAAALLLVAICYTAQAQYCGHIGTGSGPSICTAGTTLTAPGFSPPADSVPCAVRGVAYSQTVQVKMPNTVTSGGTTYRLKNIRIDSIGNLPCGLCWATNKANNTFDSSEQFCLKVAGITYDNPGQFKLNILVTATVYTGFLNTTYSQAADASAAGLNFWVRVQQNNGTCTPLDTLPTAVNNTAIAVGAVPSSAVTAGGPLTFCSGGSVTFTATEAGATAYQWFNGTNAIAGATSRTYTATTAGTYKVYIEKGCHAVTSAVQTVTVNSGPTVSVTPAGPVVVCTGSMQVLTAATSGGTLQWYNGAGAISGQTGTTYTASATGSYYAIGTLNSCTTTSNTVSVQVTGTPPTPAITATTLSLCSGATDTLDAGAGYSSYLWSNSLGTAQKAYPTAAGTYTVTVTNGVCSGSASITISAGQAPTTPTVTPSGTVAICSGSSVTLTSSAAATYHWTGGQTTQSISVSAAGSYAVTVTSTGRCGTASSTATTIAVTTTPVAGISPAGPVIICGSGSQVLTASGTGTYQWLKNGAPLSGQTAGTYTATTAGSYAVVVSSGSCADTSTAVSVQIGSALSPTISTSHTYICTGATDTLDVGSGYSSYAWSSSLGSTRYAYATTAGTYTVTVTNGACSGTATITLTARGATPTPTITAGSATTFCQGGSVVLTSSSASGNVWSNSASTQAITVTTAGSYTVTNDNGCGAATSAATVVTVNAIPNAQITPAGSTLICGGSSQTLTATPAGSYVWLDANGPISGQTAATYSASATGSYSAVVTVNGCSDTSNVATITVSGTPPTPTITATSQALCPGQTDTLNIGAGYTSYTWSNSLGTAATATVTAGGTYTVTVANGVCVGTATITITQASATPTPVISVQGSLHLCGTDSVVLTSSAASGNLWSNSATTQSITVSNAGVYSVTVGGTCGSAVSQSDTVVKFGLPLVSVSTDTGTCAGDTIALSAGNDGTSYLWSNAATTSATSVTATGEYYVSVTKNGCTSTDSVHVTFDAAPVVTFTASNGVLTASAIAGGAYQWYKNSTPVPGATAQTYDANASGTGNYSVKVTLGYCSGSSAPQTITIIGISELAQTLMTYIYPNPASQAITISYTLRHGQALDIYLTDMMGRMVTTLSSGIQADGTHELQADLSSLTGGVYFVNFHSVEGTVVRKIVKE